MGKNGYTLAFAQRIAHKGLHAETGAFPPSSVAGLCAASEIATERTAGGSGCTPVACVRFLRRRGPAGLRDFFVSVEIVACMPCTQRFLCVRSRGGITTLGVLFVLLKRRTAACQKGSFAVF